jgi:hypothetical protein
VVVAQPINITVKKTVSPIKIILFIKFLPVRYRVLLSLSYTEKTYCQLRYYSHLRAIVTPLQSEGEQFHQARLIEHLTPLDRNMQLALPQISEILRQKGVPSHQLNQGSLGIIQAELLRQASMLSFNDAFYLHSIIMAVVLFFVPLMKRGEEDVSMPGMH